MNLFDPAARSMAAQRKLSTIITMGDISDWPSDPDAHAEVYFLRSVLFAMNWGIAGSRMCGSMRKRHKRRSARPRRKSLEFPGGLAHQQRGSYSSVMEGNVADRGGGES